MLNDSVGSVQSMWCTSVHPCVFPLILHGGIPWQKRLESTDTGTGLWAELTGNYTEHKSWNPSEEWGTAPCHWAWCLATVREWQCWAGSISALQTVPLPSAERHRNDWQPAGKVTFTVCPAHGSAEGSSLWALTLHALHHFCLSCSSFLSCPFDWDPPASAGPATRSASGDWHTGNKLGLTAVTVLSCLLWSSFYLQVLCLAMLQIRIIKSHPSLYTSSGFPSTVCLLSLYVHKKTQLTVAIKAGMETVTLLLH